MTSPNDGSPTTLPADDSARYIWGAWDAVAGVWRALAAGPSRELLTAGAKGTGTNTTASITTTSGPVLAANANRKVALIYNNGPATCYLRPGAAAATVAGGKPLPAGAEFVDENTTGAWQAITASGTADVRVTEVA